MTSSNGEEGQSTLTNQGQVQFVLLSRTSRKSGSTSTMAALPERLSARKRGTFAFKTISERVPAILTKVIDTTYKYRLEAAKQYGEEGATDCKVLTGHLSKLRNLLQTDKPLYEFEDGGDDVEIWSRVLREETESRGGVPPSSFTSSWLYVECFVYRSINEGIKLSKHLKGFDPFAHQKQQALTASMEALVILASYLHEALAEEEAASYKWFAEFMQISLWGNKCDLSISAGIENSQKISPVAPLEELKGKILVNDLERVWKIIAPSDDGHLRLDIVLDNAGFELFTDLCLADFLMSTGIVESVHLHHKAMPWFVSDATAGDLSWTLEQLGASSNNILSSFGKKWQKCIRDGGWTLHCHKFWTTCHDYSEMRSVAPDLYEQLSGSDLIILKGDLNYRKLVGDREWDHTEPYERALCGFHPAPHCALRTFKADVVVGLAEGVSAKTEVIDPDWLVSGEYAVIQLSSKVSL